MPRRWRALEWRAAGVSGALSRSVRVVGRVGKCRTDWGAHDSAQRHDDENSAHMHLPSPTKTDRELITKKHLECPAPGHCPKAKGGGLLFRNRRSSAHRLTASSQCVRHWSFSEMGQFEPSSPLPAASRVTGGRPRCPFCGSRTKSRLSSLRYAMIFVCRAQQN